MSTAEAEYLPSQVQLDASILPVLDEILNDALASRSVSVRDLLQGRGPLGKIDRAPIVGVNQALSSALKEENEREFYRLVEERKKTEPYASRRVYVTVSLTPGEAIFKRVCDRLLSIPK